MYNFIRRSIFSAIFLLFTGFPAMGQVDFEKTGNSEIKVNIDGSYFTSFLFDESLPKPVLYPIFDARQNRITRGFPFQPIPGERADHPHHYGIWMNYGDVNSIDFWNNGKFPDSVAGEHYGVIQLDKETSLNEKEGTLSYSAVWKGPNGTKLIREETIYSFSGNDSTREITRESRLKALRDVKFGDSKEGFFAIRVRRELENPSSREDQFVEDTSGTISQSKKLDHRIPVTGEYINSMGDNGDAVWGLPAEWVLLKGKIGDEEVAVLMLDHSENYGYPARWMARDYGLFGVNPLGEKAYGGSNEKVTSLKEGDSLTFRYKIIFTSFTPGKEYVEAWHQEFSKQR